MQIVIDIPDDMIESLEQGNFGAKYNIYDLVGCLMNGTPLPDHHGDLKDVNVLKNNIHYVPLAPIFSRRLCNLQKCDFCGYIGYATNHHRGE